MAKKREKLTLSEVTIAEIPEPKPIGVFSNALDRVYIGVSNKTWANLASQGKGPRFSIVNGRRFYLWGDLEAYATEQPVQTVGKVWTS